MSKEISCQLDEFLLSEKENETPLGMDDTKQRWKWADVGSRRMPQSPLLSHHGGRREWNPTPRSKPGPS